MRNVIPVPWPETLPYLSSIRLFCSLSMSVVGALQVLYHMAMAMLFPRVQNAISAKGKEAFSEKMANFRPMGAKLLIPAEGRTPLEVIAWYW